MITKILIILFFVVLAIKPAYYMTELVDDNGNKILYVSCSMLIYVLLTKLKHKEKVLLISARQFDQCVEILNALDKGEKQ